MDGGGVCGCEEVGPQARPDLIVSEVAAFGVDVEVGEESVPSDFDVQAVDVHRG